jgi:ech hydrogenase subunit A
LIGVILLLIKNDIVRDWVVRIGVAVIVASAFYVAQKSFGGDYEFVYNSIWLPIALLIIETALSIFIIYISIRNKKWIITLAVLVQTVIILWYELFSKSIFQNTTQHFFIDKLTITMIIIVAVVGGLICLFALPYMKKYHTNHPEIKDRRPFFFALLFFFLSAMFGMVCVTDLSILFSFWEFTTVFSFLLIGYSKTPEAIKNAFTALIMNTIGGICFAISIAWLGTQYNVETFPDLLDWVASNSSVVVALPIFLLCIAALTKSAQLPFSKWLLGAMVAPTPVSALLHSSTMVKAGVYLLIRISPAFTGNTLPGILVIGIGTITFLATSMIAVSQSDAKKVLAYSTIANLGLIVACIGVGTYESIWAAVMLIIFHAVSKSLLFISVGKIENVLGSRDIEDMHGLIVKLPAMALLMIIGIAGMFLAPFGMLISKWAALKAFIDSGNVFVVLLLVFGSAITLFYWSKWLGKIVAGLPRTERFSEKLNVDEYVSLFGLAIITTFICLINSFISNSIVYPFVGDFFGVGKFTIISQESQIIMALMLAMVIFIPFGIYFFTWNKQQLTTVYMSGVNAGDNRSFIGNEGKKKQMYLSTWYLDNYFGEKKLLFPSILLTLAFIAVMFAIVLGGAQI